MNGMLTEWAKDIIMLVPYCGGPPDHLCMLTCETVSFVEQLVTNHDSFVAADKRNVVV